MCFSATASFALSAGLFGIGIATLANRRSLREIPLYSFPLIFSAQQFTEGLLWLKLTGGAYDGVCVALTHGFLLYAQVLWPLLVPVAIYLIEPEAFRKKVLRGMICYGALVSSALLVKMVLAPYEAVIAGHSIQYRSDFEISVLMTTLYAFAVVFPLLICSRGLIILFGGLVVLSLVITTEIYAHALYSVWCFFAAALSAIVYAFSVQNKSADVRERQPLF